MFTSGAYTLQESTIIDEQIITAVEFVVKAQYLCSMQIYINWYCNQQPKHHVITLPTHTILHPQLEVNAITDFHEISTIVCSRTQAKKSIPRQPICLTYDDYDYILEEIGIRENFDFERVVDVYSDDMED